MSKTPYIRERPLFGCGMANRVYQVVYDGKVIRERISAIGPEELADAVRDYLNPLAPRQVPDFSDHGYKPDPRKRTAPRIGTAQAHWGDDGRLEADD